MNRRVCFTLLTLLALTAPLTAHAGKWIQKEIFWSKGGGFPVNGAVTVHDTLYAPAPIKTSGTVDTTGKFSLSNADIWRTAHAGAASTVDTTIAGWLVITQDSSGSIAPTVASITWELDGRAGGFKFGPTDSLSRAWTQVDSSVATFVNNLGVYNAVLSIPIRALNGLGGAQAGGNGPENFVNMPYRMSAYEDLRVRLTAATGIMSGSLRAFIRYWDSDPSAK